MANTAIDSGSLKAIVFDIDGTLYRQGPVRRAMLFKLVAAYAFRPVEGWQTMTALRAYRHAQERLRGAPCGGDAAAAQLQLACEGTRLDRAVVADRVDRWMEREPLAILGKYAQPGLMDFLEACRTRGIRMGTLSDYPGDEKLRALGVDQYFDVRLCAQSPEIGVFKPDPRGLQVALERLGTTARETLYIGDRADVDAAAAEAAGIPCAILTSARPAAEPRSYISIPSYTDLGGLLFGPEVSPARPRS